MTENQFRSASRFNELIKFFCEISEICGKYLKL